MAYAVPTTIALWVGIHLPLRYSASAKPEAVTEPLSQSEYLFMCGLIGFGFFMFFISPYLPGSFRFFYYILAELRFVGALSLMFSFASGWHFWMALVYAMLLVQTSSAGVFYELVLWVGYWFICRAYLKKWRWKLVLYLIPAFFVITILNEAKVQYREEISSGELTITQRLTMLGNLMRDVVFPNHHSLYSVPDAHDDTLVRYNQGWIISNVMTTVPELEPYAGGKTVWDGLIDSLIPRAFLPGKIQASSRDMFNQYTNLNISEDTSMALGVAGEMYANFGSLGGVLATLVYGIFIGLIFSRFARLAKHSTLWWAWAPFVLLAAIEAEWNLGDILNHTIKSLIVMIALIFFMPVFKKRLFPRKGQS